ncbi:hypothetical protein ACF1AY_16090 [Streptomyces sp. NPDC014776]|uniref:hypothetical protein n=1 Tax=unclassified Streptomyces TaxID=2593676 RepID=UPI0036FA4E86
MTRVPTRVLVCDECGEQYGSGTGLLPAHILRRRARRAGWRWAGRNRDLCPKHPEGGAS